jgi:thiosulfate/3-mercaptopyruvate sulfurtransferase
MTYEKFIASGIIEPEELAALLESSSHNIKLIDATFVLPGAEKDPKADFAAERIDHAVFFDVDEIADKTSDLPHMLPSPEGFADAVSALGISNDSFVIAYAQHGMVMGPARAWWMFKVFGHDNVAVLNGGLPAWKAAGLPLNTEAPTSPASAVFTAEFRPELVFNMDEVKGASDTNSHQIIDARPAGRFDGSDPEPRAGLPSGHIRGSKNIPCTILMDMNTGKLKLKEELNTIFANIKYEPSKPAINSCGSGVTACMNALALYHLGHKDAISVYDGSWSEWGQKQEIVK